MNSIAHLIRFWILMAVLGSSASGADDPPIPHPSRVSVGKVESATKKSSKLKTNLANEVGYRGNSPAFLTITDPKGKLKFPMAGDLMEFLKSDS